MTNEDDMEHYTVEISGKAVVALRTVDRDHAERLVDAEDFRENLLVLNGPDGKPLWDGNSSLDLREAKAAEVRAVALAMKQDDVEHDDEYVAFLIPVSDPTDEGEENAPRGQRGRFDGVGLNEDGSTKFRIRRPE